MKNLPFPKTVSGLGKWVYDLHNSVNASLGGSHIINVPSFNEVKRLFSATTAKTEKEWHFLKCVAKTHPGARIVTPEYIHALTTFLKIWWGDVPFDVRSRRQFLAWVKSASMS
jgi:hypothetical protein